MFSKLIKKQNCNLLVKQNVHYLRSNLLIPQEVKTKSEKEHMKSISCQIMEKNGFLSDAGSGLLTYLPLGKRVVNKVTNLVRKEMNKIQGQEIEMPALCDLSLWSLTGRNELMGNELFRLKDRHDKKLCLCPTHEELVTSLVSKFSHILPSECLSENNSLKLYQITRKYRDESRPKHGLLRAREFLMKDMYTFHLSTECVENTYNEVCKAYETFFNSLNLNYIKAAASVGSMGGRLSHEYHVNSTVGEDKIFTCPNCGESISSDLIESKEKINQENLCKANKACNVKLETNILNKNFGHQKCIEIGHTFILGDRYTKYFPINLKNMKSKSVIMGCYGIGVSRIIQACIETQHIDGKYPNWSPEIAPFQVCIIPAKSGSQEEEKSKSLVNYLVEMLDKSPLFKDDILVDDRTWLTIGNRMVDAKLAGVPYLLVLGKSINEEQIEIQINSSFLEKAIGKKQIFCHSRETLVILNQINNDYLYVKKQNKLNDYFSNN